jgi:hypothetical protein
VDGHAQENPWVDYGTLSHGGTLSYQLGSQADTERGSSIRSAPPSDALGGKTALTSAGPASGLILAPGAPGTATATFTVTAGSATGSYAVGISAAGASSALNVDVAAPGDVWPYYNAVGVSSDGQDVPEGYDGSGYTYSANSLAAGGVTPGPRSPWAA